ncbi:hypothetical protein GOP47_0016691 [Adiantum capillus-veneris]|uniref:Protein kinase domain-containing protein n=1 Tax=Adiantum capillus-veneris TaxID=13818 RepID=A0A9D4UI59_ADICA|nr:hypothetical protein GOP47_0016691 [Adiantum capillus-veneris]
MDCERLCLTLQELSSSIQLVASSPSNFVLHRTQCFCLARSYALAVHHVSQQLHWVLSACDDWCLLENLVPSLSELHHAMLQGHKFLQDCSFLEGWVRKAMILALSSEAQDVCLHDLVWCLSVVHQALHQLPFAVLKTEDDVFSSLNATWADTSQKDDLMTLTDALAHNITKWEGHLSQESLPTHLQEEVKGQCCLARFLLRRLLREIDFYDAYDGFHDASAAYDTSLECLWVDPIHFTIKEAIGHGAYAVVYEVEWYGQRFGQKEFFGVDESFFGREAAIQSRLRHPNVLQLICCTSKPSRSRCSLVTELMDMDLRSMIDNRCNNGFNPPFSLATAVDLMLQIAKGMEYLHDFGMSKAKYTSSKYTTLHAGTTYWRAPEVFKVESKKELERKYTKKADVYSFAMVCYEILTGSVPFDDGNKLKTLHKRLLRGERPSLPRTCPQYLSSYIERCWHANPEKRPSFAQISRTLRHLKAILLMSVTPSSSSALTDRACAIIEDKLEQTIGADWVSNISRGVTTRSLTISFEMSWYKVVEKKLTADVASSTAATASVIGRDSQFICCVQWLFGRRSLQEHSRHTSDLVGSSLLSIRRFTYVELDRATKQFSVPLGRGGAGVVYKATLVTGQVVAIKVFSERSREVSGQAIFRELEILGRIRHRNLVPLLGFCYEGDRLLLVYKFMPGGDLENLRRHGRVLDWAHKYNIICGLALALNYLHNNCTPSILHRDVKPCNILLDENQEACLSDFGIARLLGDSDTHMTTNLMGTMGYIAPEYLTTLKLGPEADVYSFGIVVLELACGRRSMEPDAEIRHIVEYSWTLHHQKRLLGAAQESLRKEGHHYNEEELQRLLHLGLACIQSNPRDRPNMSMVVLILSKEVEAPIPVQRPYYMGLLQDDSGEPAGYV